MNTDQYHQRKAAGLCVTCGEPDPVGAQCEPCRTHQRGLQKINRHAHAKRGLCTYCTAKVVPGMKMCASHLKANAARVKKEYKRRQKLGLDPRERLDPKYFKKKG